MFQSGSGNQQIQIKGPVSPGASGAPGGDWWQSRLTSQRQPTKSIDIKSGLIYLPYFFVCFYLAIGSNQHCARNFDGNWPRRWVGGGGGGGRWALKLDTGR